MVKCLSHKHGIVNLIPRNYVLKIKNKSQAWWCVLVIPAMERQSQMGPRGLLVGKLSLLSEFWANERPLSQKPKPKQNKTQTKNETPKWRLGR